MKQEVTIIASQLQDILSNKANKITIGSRLTMEKIIHSINIRNQKKQSVIEKEEVAELYKKFIKLQQLSTKYSRREIFVAIILYIYHSYFIQNLTSSKISNGACKTLSQVLDISPSWTSETIHIVRIYFITYKEFRNIVINQAKELMAED